jgi:hypothetical protein
MPNQPANSPLGAFLKALREEEIDCILIGSMAAIEQGAPLMTSKRAAGRDKDLAALPILLKTLRLLRRLNIKAKR